MSLKCDLCGKIDAFGIVSGMYVGRLIDSFKVSFIKIDRFKSYHILCLSKEFPTFESEYYQKRHTKIFDPNALENINDTDNEIEMSQKSQMGGPLLGVSELNLKSMMESPSVHRKLSITEYPYGIVTSASSPNGIGTILQRNGSGEKINSLGSPRTNGGNITPKINKEVLVKMKVIDPLMNEFFLGISFLYVKTQDQKYLEIMKYLTEILNPEVSLDIVKNKVIQHKLIDLQDIEVSKELLKLLFTM